MHVTIMILYKLYNCFCFIFGRCTALYYALSNLVLVVKSVCSESMEEWADICLNDIEQHLQVSSRAPHISLSNRWKILAGKLRKIHHLINALIVMVLIASLETLVKNMRFDFSFSKKKATTWGPGLCQVPWLEPTGSFPHRTAVVHQLVLLKVTVEPVPLIQTVPNQA